MSCSLMTPAPLREASVLRRAASGACPADRAPESATAPTAVLDFGADGIAAILAGLASERDERALVRRAHGIVQAAVRPVYALSEAQPASVTLRRGRGSCSQRMALVEAIARGSGVGTRTRGLIVSGEFWYPRFPLLRRAVPDRILVAWPEFLLGGEWQGITDALAVAPGGPGTAPAPVATHADNRHRAEQTDRPGHAAHPDHAGHATFTNAGSETLFDAVALGTADWSRTAGPACDCGPSLADFVLDELGVYSSRDALFERFGQNLRPPVRVVVEPFFSRYSAGGGLSARASGARAAA